MLEVKNKIVECLIKNAFDSGFAKASASFSMMTKGTVSFTNLHADFQLLKNPPVLNQGIAKAIEPSWLITTEVFGEVSGKSYLLLSEKEFETLMNLVHGLKKSSINLEIEFIKELDNILSASVVTQLSNEFKLKMYGDIPNLVGMTLSTIEEIIYDDFCELTNEIYINSIQFTLKDYPVFQPLFIWVLDRNTLQLPDSK